MKGHIAKKKTGENTFRYYPVIDTVDENGKRKRKWLQGFRTKKEAQAHLNEKLAEIQKGQFVDPTKMTVSQFLDYWMENFVATSCTPLTHEKYKYDVDAYFKPFLGHYQIGQLQPAHIQKYYADMLKSGNIRKGGGLSKITVENHHRLLRSAFNKAVIWQMIGKNPFDSVQKPKPEHKEMNILTFEQVNALLDAMGKSQYYGIVFMAIYTGMRKGEILGLRWKDVNLEAGTIKVTQTLQRVIGKGLVYGEPKTGSSRRTIHVSLSVVELLKEIKVRQTENKLQYGPEYQDHGLVFCQKIGKPIDQQQMRKTYKAALRRAGLPDIRFHDLRHTHASLLLSEGSTPLKVVQERLGHSRPSITADVYSHALPHMQKEAANLFEEKLTSTKTSTVNGRK